MNKLFAPIIIIIAMLSFSSCKSDKSTTTTVENSKSTESAIEDETLMVEVPRDMNETERKIIEDIALESRYYSIKDFSSEDKLFGANEIIRKSFKKDKLPTDKLKNILPDIKLEEYQQIYSIQENEHNISIILLKNTDKGPILDLFSLQKAGMKLKGQLTVFKNFIDGNNVDIVNTYFSTNMTTFKQMKTKNQNGNTENMDATLNEILEDGTIYEKKNAKR